MQTNQPNNQSSVFNLSFIASSSIIFAGSFVVNVLNYLFTLSMSRALGVEAFGEVTALFSLLLLVSVPASALTMLMTRQAAVYASSAKTNGLWDMFQTLRRNVALSSLFFWLLFLVAVPEISRFLQIPYLPIFIFSLLIPLTLASSLQSGTLQGLQEFYLLSKQNVLSTLVKLGASILLVMAGFSVVGVMVGVVLASLVSWGYGYVATRRFMAPSPNSPHETAFSFRSIQTLFSTILCTTLLLVLLSNIDVLLSKHYLSSELAGQYGALSTLGKILVYGIGAFITVLLPMASAAHARDKKAAGDESKAERPHGQGGKLLWFSLGIITLSSLAVYALFTLFPTHIVTILFGAKYIAVAPYLGVFSIAMSCISLSTALINYFVAVENASFLFFLIIGILFEVMLIAVHHATLQAMTTSLLLSGILLLFLMLCNYCFILYRKHL